MLRIRDLILPETHDVSELYYHAAQALHVRASDIAALHIFRRSLDARKTVSYTHLTLPTTNEV